jgi:hypothetical protein
MIRMTRTSKALGPALLAVLAIGAVTAPVAPAATQQDHFVSETETTVLTGTGNLLISTKKVNLNLTCKHQTFADTLSQKEVTTLGLVPTYTECSTPAGNSTVDSTNCEYVIGSLTTDTTAQTDGKGTERHAKTDIVCTAGSAIKITAPSCTVTINTQENLHGLTFENKADPTKSDITINVTVDKVKYTSTGFGCALIGLPAEGADGLITGSITVTGYEDKDVAFPTTHSDQFEEGAQVGIAVTST